MFAKLTELFIDWSSTDETDEQPIMINEELISSIRPGGIVPKETEATVIYVGTEKIWVKGKYEDFVEMVDRRRAVS
jgi:hypothetical protein